MSTENVQCPFFSRLPFPTIGSVFAAEAREGELNMRLNIPTHTRITRQGRAARVLTVAAFSLLAVGLDTAVAQWTGDANLQTFQGKVAIGTTTTASKLEVVNPTGGAGNGTYLQVTGSTADNSNYPDIVLRGGNGVGYSITGYPSMKATNAGYALALWGGYGALIPNPTVALLDSGSGSFLVSTGSTTMIRAWSSGSLAIGTAATPAAVLDVHGASQASGSARRNVVAFDSTAFAQGVGGGISFGGNYSAASSTVDFANIWGIKENATVNDNAGALLFATQANGASPSEHMRIGSNGLVTIAPAGSTGTRLTVNGDINVTGNINAKYQDVAEWVPVAAMIPAGTVVVLDPSAENQVTASSEPYSTAVAGVVSDHPGLVLGEEAEKKVKVATTGRVLVNVDATKAPIRIGDLLVTSAEKGFAMRSEPVDLGGIKMHRPGTIIGKALQPLDSGHGEILVLLSLQ